MSKTTAELEKVPLGRETAVLNSIAAKVPVKEKTKALLKKLSKKAGVSAELRPIEYTGAPLFLMIGSLQGCSLKDAYAYARGLAQKYTSAQDSTWIHVFEQRVEGRFVYEIQEGGSGQSVADKVLTGLTLDATPTVIILANGRYAEVADVRGEVSTLIYPQESDINGQPGIARAISFGQLVTAASLRMKGFNQIDVILRKVALRLLSFSGAMFFLVGAWAVFVGSGLYASKPIQDAVENAEIKVAIDDPIANLNRARSDAEAKSVLILKLTKKDGSWSYVLSETK